jgi:hypothetical protein
MTRETEFDPCKPVEMFDAFVPRNVQEAIAAGIVREYQLAKVACETEHRLPESDDLLPFCRRACIESMLCEVGKSYPNAHIVTRLNKSKSCSHRILLCERVVLTQSLVDHEGMFTPRGRIQKGICS